MKCPMCDEPMKFVVIDGVGRFQCPSCDHVKEVEHVEVKI